MAKGRRSGIAWAALIIAIIALGLSGYLFYTTTLQPKPMARVHRESSYLYYTAGFSTFKIDFNKETIDTHNAFDLTSDVFIAPESGYYVVTGTVTIIDLNDGEMGYVSLRGQGSTLIAMVTGFVSSSIGSLSLSVTDVVWLEAGYNISLWVFFSGSGTKGVTTGSGLTFFTICKA
jgi:hypothetical protein